MILTESALRKSFKNKPSLISGERYRDGTVFTWHGEGNIATIAREAMPVFWRMLADGSIPWEIIATVQDHITGDWFLVRRSEDW